MATVREEVLADGAADRPDPATSAQHDTFRDDGDDGGAQRPPPAMQDASLASRWLFSWAYQLLRTGMARPLQEYDLPELLEQDTSAYNRRYMEHLWYREKQRAACEVKRKRGRLFCGYMRRIFRPSKPSLYHALIFDYFRQTWHAQCILVVSMAARLGQSLALGLLIEQFVPGEGGGPKIGYAWACTMIGCGVVFLFCKQQQFFTTHRKGMTMRLGLLVAIYSKALRLSSIGGTMGVSSGQVVNLASNDVERYLSGSPLMIYFVYAPIEAVAILITGLSVVGPAFAAGFGLLLIFIPLQFYLARRFASLRSKVAAITDARVNLVSQAVQGVRIMKMHGWEHKFADRIAELRLEEMHKVISASRYKSLNDAINFSTSVAVSVITFSVHVWTGGTLTSRVVFTAMSMINILQASMTKIFSNAVMHLSECWVSSRRIQLFLETPDLSQTPTSDNARDENAEEEGQLVTLSDVTCYWNEASRFLLNLPDKHGAPDGSLSSEEGPTEAEANDYRAALLGVNLTFYSGGLYCVIGPVGGSKSALLQSIAGELLPSHGKIERIPKIAIAYAQQDPWVFDGTVRENILFGLEYNEDWYEQVIHACGLSIDMEQFPDGDATVVGDRGVQCSGGQRARLGLARAIYRDADLTLLDDPLSAVDSKVGRLIFYSAIMELCVDRGKCVVLATHQHQFVGDAKCILMIDGQVKCHGSYSSCVEASGGRLAASFQTSEKEGATSSTPTKGMQRRSSLIRKASTRQAYGKQSEGVLKEDRDTGLIKMSTWKDYAVAMGGLWVGVSLLVLFVVTQASSLVAIVYMGEWAEQPGDEQSSSYWLGLVWGLALALIALALMRSRTTFFCCLKASQRLHDVMCQAVLRAKVEFFDTSSLGRILNRFSADVGIADDQLPLTLVDFLVGFFLAIGSVATAIVSLPMTLIALPPLLWYFMKLRKIFVTTTRELKRLEGLARSPIYAMIGEALSGVATMRTNNAVEYFLHKFEGVHDQHGRAFFAFVASSRWFATRMDVIAFIFMAVTSILAVLFHDQGWLNISPAVLGMCLTLLLQMAGTNFPWVVRLSAEVVNQMISIERISAFGHLPSEAALVTKYDDDVGGSWPLHPSISTTELSVRYRASLPPALSGISFQVKSGERVGIVGRTGSGKSSLVQALFRVLEAEEGKIEIDGVDISKLGLHKLRQSISVIPQSPVLFSGTSVRFNLDPFDAYDDETIRSALADAQILDVVEELPEGIHSIVAESGSNFSVGQRQLLCLSRAILRKSRILILDESSANIDNRTDALLQQAVAKSFKGATILSVAHRLESIIDHDLALVLGKGKVLEFGAPMQLLTSDGHFASMVESTGEQMSRSLRASALLGPMKREK